MSNEEQQQQQTKACIQCGKNCTKDQFPKKQWKRKKPSCRLCAEFKTISKEKSRQCHQCKVVQPRFKFDIYQWGKGAEALCPDCKDLVEKRVLDSIKSGDMAEVKNLPDGTAVCFAHSLERCDSCMMDFTLPNQFARERKVLGRDLTEDEAMEITQEAVHINQKICIMDGQSMCPRSGRKLRCPCGQVTYCSKACQNHHWMIHKMTCKVHAKTKADKAAKAAAQPAHGLTEEQLDYVRIEAFMAENRGGKHSIEECAWQLGEHPLIIGGGSVQMGVNETVFIKGDVAKIYLEMKGVLWDGSPRFGYPTYVQQKTPEDWIARARRGTSQQEKQFRQDFLTAQNFNIKSTI